MASCDGATFHDGGRFGIAFTVRNIRAMNSGGRVDANRPHMRGERAPVAGRAWARLTNRRASGVADVRS